MFKDKLWFQETRSGEGKNPDFVLKGLDDEMMAWLRYDGIDIDSNLNLTARYHGDVQSGNKPPHYALHIPRCGDYAEIKREAGKNILYAYGKKGDSLQLVDKFLLGSHKLERLSLSKEVVKRK